MSDARKATIAVTGLNAGDNPGPGVTVLRAIREAAGFEGRLVGLVYDSLEPGIYASDLVDDVFILPYPSEGVHALEARLTEIRDKLPLDVIVPNLDAELDAFITLAPDLDATGTRTFLPSKAQLELRDKTRLTALGRDAGLSVPTQRVINDVRDLYSIHEHVEFPLLVKGVYYGAKVCHDVNEAVAAFHDTVARWGLPVIVQDFVAGTEYDVVAVGDGRGGLVGAVPMRKTTITDKGKGWAGITVKDPALIDAAERFMAASRWRGPCEVEVMRDRDGVLQLMEINPRFPAWSYLSAGAGLNLPWAVVRLAMNETVPPARDFEAGVMFVRIAIDQIARIEDFETLTTSGELHRERRTR
jgi:carbamoyl-phosphate synthase large subunit